MEESSLGPQLAPRLLTALRAAALRLDAAGVPFVVGGGTGRALLGWRTRPADLDLEVDEADAARAGAALGLRLVPASGGGWSSLRATGRIGAVEVDCSAGVGVARGALRLPAAFAAQVAHGVRVPVAGVVVTAAPPEEMLVRALVAGDPARQARVRAGAPPGWAPDEGYVASRLAAASAAR